MPSSKHLVFPQRAVGSRSNGRVCPVGDFLFLIACGLSGQVLPVLCPVCVPAPPAPPMSFYRFTGKKTPVGRLVVNLYTDVYRSRVCPGSPRCLFTGTKMDARAQVYTSRG